MNARQLGAVPVYGGTWDLVQGQQTTKIPTNGITLRQHLASLAMQAIVASKTKRDPSFDGANSIATLAIAHADALLEELAKGG